MELKDKVVVVTGAAGGIGNALVNQFRAEGAIVIGSDLKKPEQTQAARFLNNDISTEAGVKALIDDVLAHEGRIDLFCSNAGIALPMDAFAPEKYWDKTIDINLKSHYWAARHVLPHMIERGSGYLLNTASAAGLLNEIDSVGYGVTKHAALGLAEWLAFSYQDKGIRVSVLCPEGVMTPMIKYSPYLQMTAITPEELAKIVSEGIHAERFMIVTHPHTLEAFQKKAANYEGFIKYMRGRREQQIKLIEEMKKAKSQ